MVKINRIGKVSILVMALVVIGLLSLMPTSPAVQAMSKIGSPLRDLIVASPQTPVRAIVHLGDTNAGLETLITQLGGTPIRDLSILNALVVEIPAGQVRTLAAHEAVRWVSLDGVMTRAGNGNDRNTRTGGNAHGNPNCRRCPANYYPFSLNVYPTWLLGLNGEGVTVAVIDSGVAEISEFSANPWVPPTQEQSRILARLGFNETGSVEDSSGHGTHVAGIIGGNGYHSRGLYHGVAPRVNLVSLSVSNGDGMAYESDTVAAMQWVLEHKDEHNIRVVNLSINSTVEQSYHTSALDAAAEILWFNGIVVVASAGNKGPAGTFNTANAAPANDPFIITVGAIDEHDTILRRDDTLAPFSALGVTVDGFSKPDIVAPGTGIISALAPSSTWDDIYPDRVINEHYYVLSGTSMSAPMVSGAVALLLQDEPHLTPDQVKYRLLQSAGEVNGFSYLDVFAAVTGTTTESANTGVQASQLLWQGSEPLTWTSVNWNSVNWNSVNWNSVNWNSVNWNSVNWHGGRR